MTEQVKISAIPASLPGWEGETVRRHTADVEANRIMREELRRLEQWMALAPVSNTDDYANACERAIELRKRLGLPAYGED